MLALLFAWGFAEATVFFVVAGGGLPGAFSTPAEPAFTSFVQETPEELWPASVGPGADGSPELVVDADGGDEEAESSR